MSLFLDSLNILELRSESRRARLNRDLQHLGVDMYVGQETRFHSGDHDDILKNMMMVVLVVTTWLVRRSLNIICTLVLSDLEGRLCVGDATIKHQVFSFSEVHAPNDSAELATFFSVDRSFFDILSDNLTGD